MHYGGEWLASGSCFFWAFEGRTYLVTNWHNLAGRNPLTGELMSNTGAIPDRIRFMAYKPMSEPDTQGYFELNYLPVEVELYKSDSTDPKWLEHPSLGRRVDVAALDVTETIDGLQIDHVNRLESDAILDPFASQDIFVVGLPFGMIANAPAPIWKRGSIALDPTFDPEGLPKMLIDTEPDIPSRVAVVIARHIIIGRQYPKKDGSQSQTVLYSRLNLVIGIYSGRHYPDLEKAQLGIVWKRTAIEQTLEAKKVAGL
jgi:hypothetical protein